MKSKRIAATLLPAAYASWLAALKDRVRSAHLQAAARVNHELLQLCQEKNRFTVEYTLRDPKKRIGLAEWRTRLGDSLPKKLQGSLPSVAEIERELRERNQKDGS